MLTMFKVLLRSVLCTVSVFVVRMLRHISRSSVASSEVVPQSIGIPPKSSLQHERLHWYASPILRSIHKLEELWLKAHF